MLIMPKSSKFKRSRVLCSSEYMNIVWNTSMSWSSVLLITCPASLPQNFIDAAINDWRRQQRAACMQIEVINFKTLAVSIRWDWRCYGQSKINFVLKKICSISLKTVIFTVLMSPQIRHLWGEKANHLSMAYLLSSNCTNSIRIGQLPLKLGGSVAEWLACWTQAQKGPGSNRSRGAVG